MIISKNWKITVFGAKTNLVFPKIINIEIDTYSNKDLFFSHRKAFHNNSLPTGRMINLIGFRDST